MKTTRRDVEDRMKGNREECMLNGRIGERRGERGARTWEEMRGDGKRKPKTMWKMQRERN
jgi:hypothetical protein